MSIQYDEIREEMEVNRTLQNVIVAHHIIQVVNLVVGIIICGATSHFYLMLLHLSGLYQKERGISPYQLVIQPILTLANILFQPILPAFVFVIFWIASQCNYQNLRHILVHFNFILNVLWFMTVFPIFIISVIVPMGSYRYPYSREFDVVLNSILSFSSICFAVCAIWKAARNVVLNEKLATMQQVYEHRVIRIPRATYGLPMRTRR